MAPADLAELAADAELAGLARSLDARTGAARTVLIDGRSGSGKSTLASRLAALRPDATLIRLDAIYPGWDGLAWASDHLQTSVLQPRSLGYPAAWREWNWQTGSPAGWHPVPADRPLIVEGVGSLSAANRTHADLAIWVECADADRKARAITRDGDTYAPHWERWAAQEELFLAQNHPTALADIIAVPTEHGFHLTETRRAS